MPDIDTNSIYKQLKKQNGEAFARVIRDAVLLDIPNIVHILEFAGHNAAEAEELVPIIREVYKEKTDTEYKTDADPIQLLSKAGYDAFVVKTEEEKNSIKHYYRPSEEICTFRDPQRHIKYYMIHAVKRGADNIKPAKNPHREDEYGRSVISIQILKTGGFISIKNRYNHTVRDPDATFNNNPDQIIPGLSYSLKNYFNVDFNTAHAQMPSHFRMVGDQLVRFDYEIDNIYFGPDYYFSGSTITKLNKTNQILFYRGFVLNIAKGNNTVVDVAGTHEKFCTQLNNFLHDKKINRTIAADKTITVLVDGERFMDIKDGLITFINAPNFDAINFHNGVDLAGDLDFSGVKVLIMKPDDLAQESKITSIKFNPYAEEIVLWKKQKLPGDLDFSHVNVLSLFYTDLTVADSIKFNPNADSIIINYSKLSGDLDFSGVNHIDLENADLTDVKNIKLNPNASDINLATAKLSGDLDFGGVRHLQLKKIDFTDVKSIKFNSNATSIIVTGNKLKLSGDLDFSGIEHLIRLNDADLTNVKSIKFPKKATHIDFSGCHGLKLSGDLDFSQVKYLDLGDTDLTNVKSIKLYSGQHGTGSIAGLHHLNVHNDLDFSVFDKLYIYDSDLTKVANLQFPATANTISLISTKLSGDLDFSTVKHLDLSSCDFTNVKSIKFDRQAYSITLNNTKLFGYLDFGDVGHLSLNNADFTNVDAIKFNRHADSIDLDNTKLSGNLDFSSVKYLSLNNADLTNVESIVLPTVAGDLNLCNTKLMGELDFSFVDRLNLSGADLNNVKKMELNRSPLMEGVKSAQPLILDIARTTTIMANDLTGLTNVILVDPNRNRMLPHLQKTAIAGTWDFSKLVTNQLNIIDSDLTKVTKMTFKPDIKIEIKQSNLGGDLDFSSVQDLKLVDCDLSQMKSIKFNPDPNTDVYLWNSKFAGDLDFGNRNFIALMGADFSNVKRITVGQRLYRAIKNQDVVMNGKSVKFKDLHKYGIVIEKINVFTKARQKVLDKIAALNNQEKSTDRE